MYSRYCNQIFVTWLTLLALAVPAWTQQKFKTRNVILVTADGVRWQDLFTGMDPALMNEKAAGMQEDGAKELRARLWRDTPEARREALAPFLWKEFIPRGVALGNVSKGSSAKVSNAYSVSYPGYSEILTGRAQDDAIRGNTPIQNPTPTVLEFVREKLRLPKTQVALIGTWDTLMKAAEHTPGAVTANAGLEKLDFPNPSPRMRELDQAQFDIIEPWGGQRCDYTTLEISLEYLRQYKPRLLHIAFGETDEWSHERRYDRVLMSISFLDRSLRKLWSTLESMPEYRGTTTVIFTTDHGRGGTLKDFSDHGDKVAGANQIWMVIAGPDTPKQGEKRETREVFQRDISPTILTLLGIDPGLYTGVLGTPVRAALP